MPELLNNLPFYPKNSSAPPLIDCCFGYDVELAYVRDVL